MKRILFLQLFVAVISFLSGCVHSHRPGEEGTCAACFQKRCYANEFYMEKQSETDVLYSHLSRITNIPVYNEYMKCYDQFLLIDYPGVLVNHNDYLFSAQSFDFMDTESINKAYDFSTKVNTVVISGKKNEQLYLDQVLSDRNMPALITSAELNASFFPVFTYPADTIRKWEKINYKDYLDIQLVSEGMRIGNIRFPKDSISCEIAGINLQRNVMDFMPKLRLNKGTYAAITKVFLIKNLYLEIYSAEPTVEYEKENNAYKISTVKVNDKQETLNAVAYVCSIFYKK